MPLATAQLLVNVLGAYAVAGAVFALLFLWVGATPARRQRAAGRMDGASRRRAPQARPRARRDPPTIRPLRRAHLAIALLLATLLPLVVAAALAARRPW